MNHDTRGARRAHILLPALLLMLLAACGGGGSGGSEPQISISDATVTEGLSGTADLVFSVSLSAAAGDTVSVDYTTADDSAASGSDYTATSGTLSIAAGATQGSISVPINGDASVERDEILRLNLSDPDNATLADAQASGTIVNDDFPQLSALDALAPEGDSGTGNLAFTVNLSEAFHADVRVDYTTIDATADAASDYTATTATLTIPAGATSGIANVSFNGDTQIERDELLELALSNPFNATLANAAAEGTIVNDDFPVLSITRASAPEGDSGTSDLAFLVSLNAAGFGDITVDFATSNVTASAASDYSASVGTLSIAEGDTAAMLVVSINGDTEYESDETFSVSLSNLSPNALLGIDQAFGTIVSDDVPTLTLLPASVDEGDIGTRALTFALTLQGPTGEVTLDYATVDGTATAADNDYTPVANGSLVIPAGDIAASITIEVNGDTAEEADETFSLQLSNVSATATVLLGNADGTIVDDDAPAIGRPTVSVGSVALIEGDAPGITDMTFTLNMQPAAATSVRIDYSTVDADALAGSDYTARSSLVRFDPGDTQVQFTVPVIGDDLVESDEVFNVTLTNRSASTADLFTTQVSGRIVDDDGPAGPPRLNVSDTSVVEGNSGSFEIGMQVSLTAPASNQVTVQYSIDDATAVAGSDYTVAAASGTLTFPPGTTVQLLNATVLGDTVVEANETFSLTLSAVTGDAVLGDAFGGVEIRSDDPFARVSISDASALEGGIGDRTDLVFTVTLDRAAADPVDMDFTAVDISASNGDDYTRVPGTLVIPASDLQGTITVQVDGDADLEPDESFTIDLSNLSGNATFADASGLGGIVNDDASAGWGLAQQLSGANSSARNNLAMNAAGDAMAVWNEDLIPSDEYSRRYSPSGGWAAQELLPTSTTRAENNDLSMDPAGNAFFAFNFGATSVSRHVDGTGWSTETDLDPLLNQESVNVANNDTGEALVVWKSNTAVFNVDNLMYSRYDPVMDAWQATDFVQINAQNAFGLVLAMDPNGSDAAAGWLDGGMPVVSLYDGANDTWTAPVNISDELSPGFFNLGSNLQIAMDQNGNVLTVWNDSHFQGANVWSNRYDATAADWDGPAIIDQAAGVEEHRPQLAMNDAGDAFAVWLRGQSGSGPNSVWSRRYTAAGGWDATVEFVADPAITTRMVNNTNFIPGNYDLPQPVINASGDMALAWSQNVAGNYGIRVSRYVPGTGWGAAEPIVDVATTDNAFTPRIGIDASANLNVVWSQESNLTPDTYSVWQNRYTAP